MAPTFIDRVAVHALAGDGGDGCASVHREKFKPLGGPDGGNGGRGGSVILTVDASVTTLLEFHRHPHLRARSGSAGRGGNRTGAEGDDLILRVPVGTVVHADADVIADLTVPGATFVLARGGTGGLGNAALSSPRRKAPGFALLGEPGEAREAVLELKTVADAALVGFPSAGKSSLISAMSAAKPKVADYPFTTLEPHLGVVEAGDVTFTMADVPGLIPGASSGRGLGLEFLRHIERCDVILHVVDCATIEPHRDPLSDLDSIEAELAAYGGFEDRPRLVALNKIDVPEARDLADLVTPDIQERGWPVFAVSAASHEGLRELRFAIARYVQQRPAPESQDARIVIRPKPVDDRSFTVERSGDMFVVRGAQPERWVRQTDFANDEAVGYLADRLARLGVEEELLQKGAEAGCTVVIGSVDDGVVFDWEPTIAAGGNVASGPRGTDRRVSD